VTRSRRSLAILAVNGVALLAAGLVAGVAGLHFERDKHPVSAPLATGQRSGPAATAERPAPPMRYLGVYVPTSPGTYSGMTRFANLTGRRPNIAVYYSSWWEPFRLQFARSARADGAMPMVQVEPHDVSLAKVAAGGYDPYLSSYAGAVRRYKSPVIIAFGHEMNANWYGWGYQHTSPATFVKAWRHVHDVFTAAGARNVIWLWVVNVTGGHQVTAIGPWWPGNAYVTWAGIDGHYFNTTVRFSQLYGGTLTAVHRLTSQPVLVAEVGIGPSVPAERITDVFSSAQAHGMIGVVWFDVTGHNIRLASHPPALSAFRKAIAAYERLPEARPAASATRR
jgi:mannan endo-1,4-beta-mannosidase